MYYRGADVNQPALTKVIEWLTNVDNNLSIPEDIRTRLDALKNADEQSRGYSAEFKTLLKALYMYMKDRVQGLLIFHAPYMTIPDARKEHPKRQPFSGFLSPDGCHLNVSCDLY